MGYLIGLAAARSSAFSSFWLGEHVTDAPESITPQLLELGEQLSRLGDGVDIGLDELLTAPAGPVNEPGLRQDVHMLLHSGRAHRIQTGQPRDRQRPAHGTADDVAPGAVGQRPEDAISVIFTGPSTYNHMVVRLAAPANDHADRRSVRHR